MWQDYEVARKVWDGVLPVEFVLELDAPTTSDDPPRPYYAMLQRISYLSAVVPKITAYLQTSAGLSVASPQNLTFHYNQAPLKTYYPLGVLFDRHNSDALLPWVVTVKVTKSPDTENGCVSRDQQESMFRQSNKEADQLRRRATVVNDLRAEEHRQMWNGLIHNRFDEFWAINERLVASTADTPLLALPIRLYPADGSAFRQKPLPPSADGKPLTVRDAALQLGVDPDGFRLLSHGVALPQDAPISWLGANFAYPDGFVHIAVAPL